MAATPQEQNAEIISALDIPAEYQALGVQVSGTPRESGMVSCYAFGRKDRNPSAWINIKTGYYGDSGGKDSAAVTYSLWDFAANVANVFPDWQSARKAFAQKAGVTLGRGRPPVIKWRDKLEFQGWDIPGNEILAKQWCMKVKPGITVEAIKAAGGQIAYYPCWIDKNTKEKKRTKNCRQVIALPCYGQWGLRADPVAWVIFEITGREFDTTPRDHPKSEPRITAKMLSVGPTAGATMGLSSLMMLEDPEQRDRIEWVWKTAGPTDLLQFISSWPTPDAGKCSIAICNAGGETSDVPAAQAAQLAGLKVAVVGDRDDAGVVGAEKWAKALDGISAETRLIELPYPIEPKHGKDLRDFLTEKSFGDLAEILANTPPWTPEPQDQLPPNGKPDDKSIDLFTDKQIAQALKIDVLGCVESDRIKVYSEHLARTMEFGSVSRMKYEDLLQRFGTPVRRVVCRGTEDIPPGMYSVSNVREALAHLASDRLIGDETELGPGCWSAENGNQADAGIVLVNAGEAMFYNGTDKIERITHPRFRDRLLSFEAGAQPFYEYKHLAEMLKQVESPKWRSKVVDDLCDLFSMWRWRGKSEVMIISGLVLSTWIQTIWAWRPRIDVLGGSNTGKSMLCTALQRLFSDCCILTSDTTAAGLRQEIKNSAVAVIVDEVDGKNKTKMQRQREILEMLRSASRGTTSLRGTGGGQKGVKFTLRHLVWVAGIAIQTGEQADKNRSISLNLEPPEVSKMGNLVLPTADILRELGQRVLATAMWAARSASQLAVTLKSHKIEGIDARMIESYAVPAAMLATVLDYDADVAKQMMVEMLQDVATDGEIESDETILVAEILGSTRRLGPVNYTVGQMLETIKTNPIHRDVEAFNRELATVGIKADGNEIVFLYRPLRKLFPHDSAWSGQPVDQYLRRIEGHVTIQRSVGGTQSRGVMFDFDWFCNKYMTVDYGETAGDGVF